MKKIYLLDCTLRDGGYVNDWNFGSSRIRGILKLLSESNIEYIECGYLTEQCEPSADSARFTNLAAVDAVLPRQKIRQRYAVMIDYGTYSLEHLDDASAYAPVIRVCFHKKDSVEALTFCELLVKKGYDVFVQPMVSPIYSDAEFIDMIRAVNRIKPAAFYIVDSFGSMELGDFKRLLFLTDHNLSQNILLGYHAHNNLQQAYENAKYMAESKLSHDIILDASVYGMGRGAGNLHIEMFAYYLNANYGKTYNVERLWDVFDDYLSSIFAERYWGYSMPFYLSALNHCHPNYAAYFACKGVLSYRLLDQLLASLPTDVKNTFLKDAADRYYTAFLQLHPNLQSTEKPQGAP